MALAVQRHVAVRTTANATTPMECVCVSQDTQGRHVTSDCVKRDTTVSSVKESVRATDRTLAGTLKKLSNFNFVIQLFQIFQNLKTYNL